VIFTWLREREMGQRQLQEEVRQESSLGS